MYALYGLSCPIPIGRRHACAPWCPVARVGSVPIEFSWPQRLLNWRHYLSHGKSRVSSIYREDCAGAVLYLCRFTAAYLSVAILSCRMIEHFDHQVLRESLQPHRFGKYHPTQVCITAIVHDWFKRHVVEDALGVWTGLVVHSPAPVVEENTCPITLYRNTHDDGQGRHYMWVPA